MILAKKWYITQLRQKVDRSKNLALKTAFVKRPNFDARIENMVFYATIAGVTNSFLNCKKLLDELFMYVVLLLMHLLTNLSINI